MAAARRGTRQGHVPVGTKRGARIICSNCDGKPQEFALQKVCREVNRRPNSLQVLRGIGSSGCVFLAPVPERWLGLCACGERCGMGHVPRGSGGLEPGQGLTAQLGGLHCAGGSQLGTPQLCCPSCSPRQHLRALELHRGANAPGRPWGPPGRSSRTSGTCSHHQRPVAPRG